MHGQVIQFDRSKSDKWNMLDRRCVDKLLKEMWEKWTVFLPINNSDDGEGSACLVAFVVASTERPVSHAHVNKTGWHIVYRQRICLFQLANVKQCHWQIYWNWLGLCTHYAHANHSKYTIWMGPKCINPVPEWFNLIDDTCYCLEKIKVASSK